MDINLTTKPERLECDVAIVGAGGAGLAAAVAASEQGARVIILEKRRKPGGNSAMAEGFFAVESPVQRKSLIDARRDEFFRKAMDYCHWTLDPRIIRAFVDKSGDTVRWLQEKGLQIDAITAYYPNQNPMVWHCPDRRGAVVVETLLRSCDSLGVMIRSETAAKKIITDELGRVVGVLAEGNYKELEIGARRVILASGGFVGNEELLKKYCPNYPEGLLCLGLPHQGDGLQMALALGANVEGLGNLHVAGPDFVSSRSVRAVVHEPSVVWVNKRGERFIDEAVGLNHFESVNAIIRQPDKACYAVIDDRIKCDMIENGFVTPYGNRWVTSEIRSNLDRDLRTQADRGRVKLADTWDEIAGWVGADPAVLKGTIKDYNSYCSEGYDAVFAKERRHLQSLGTPPYYAIKCDVILLTTMGGIKINHRMEVLDGDDNPIEGLYAVGNDAGGWEPATYDALLTGTAFGFALNSGRIAGEGAAKGHA